MTTTEHYETLLAECYDWMRGGWQQNHQASRLLFEEHNLAGPGLAIDLGAGTGYQSVSLAQRGFDVVAFDLSIKMLEQLVLRGTGLSIRCIEASMLEFPKHLDAAPNLIVCMGDSLPHLESIAEAAKLLHEANRSLAAGGHLVLQFRDLSVLPEGDARFLPIRSDAEQIFTCFLEEVDEEKVRVHDILHVRDGDGFRQSTSSYLKLRLDPKWVDRTLEALALRTLYSSDEGGIVTRVVCKTA